MDPLSRTALMHTVLDGTATTDEAHRLEALVADDAGARAEFASWKSMFDSLAAMPMAHPPEGLVAAVTAALPSRAGGGEYVTDPGHQLSSRSDVIGSGQARSVDLIRTISTDDRRYGATREFGHMNNNRKTWVLGGVAVAALVVAAVAFKFPPRSEDVIGTVVPAERYRATQSGAEVVKLDTPAGSTGAAGLSTPGIAEANATLAARTLSLKDEAARLAKASADANLAVQNNKDAALTASLTAQADKMAHLSVDAARIAGLSSEASLKVSQAMDASRAVYRTNEASSVEAGKLQVSQLLAESKAASLAFASSVDAANFASYGADASHFASLAAEAGMALSQSTAAASLSAQSTEAGRGAMKMNAGNVDAGRMDSAAKINAQSTDAQRMESSRMNDARKTDAGMSQTNRTSAP